MRVEKRYTQDVKDTKVLLEFAGFAEVATEENGGVAIYDNGSGKQVILVPLREGISAHIVLIDKNAEK